MNALPTPSLPNQLEFGSAYELRLDVAELVKPPRRIKVSEAAEKYCRVLLPSGSFGNWDPDLTPYLIEPMDLLNDRRYDGVVLIGPARAGKTVVTLGWMAYVVICDPGDMQVIHSTKDMARDYSRREVDRMIRNSPEMKARLSTGHDDNTFDKIFKAGNMLTISWPTIEQLSSRGMKYIAATDYDRRLRDDVNSEGDLFSLMGKRTESYMSSGTRLLETSPGFPILDPAWKPSTPHEGPPCEGAFSWYNYGDRRRLYWQCMHCGEYFLAEWEHLKYDESDDLQKAASTVRCECPHCHEAMLPRQRRELNRHHQWLRDGEEIKPDGTRIGTPEESNIASFWFQGPAACFQTWESLTLDYLRAKHECEKTGSEESLKRTITQDQGRPYLPKARESERSYVDLMDRAEDFGKRVVPPGVRFLLASIDIQKDSFVVQVEGFGIGLEHWYIDRFSIVKSKRLDDDGDPLPLRPATYNDDWLLLIDQVINRTYPLSDDSRRHMRIRFVACDSGGKAGVTERAYKFYRRLRSRGLVANFMLVKGDTKGPRIKRSFPDSDRKDRKAGARGEIPVHLLNTVILKDHIYAGLDRIEPGPGCSHFPTWFEDWWYKELLAEVKEGEKYIPIARRNESLDLTLYNRASLLRLKAEEINWNSPPRWAMPWDDNSMVIDPDRPDESPKGSGSSGKKKGGSLRNLGRELGA